MKFTTRTLAALAFATTSGLAVAHGFSAGDLKIGHPYAAPSLRGTTTGAAYLTELVNNGTADDRLLRASTPAASRVEMHEMQVDAQGVMRMREIESITVKPKAPVMMQPGMGKHLMLIGLKEPLKAGGSFPLTLEFERAGKVEVNVVVQEPKPAEHKH